MDARPAPPQPCFIDYLKRTQDLFKISFHWSIVALQCCISFYCRAKWISHTRTYIPSVSDFLPIQITTEHWEGSPVPPSRLSLVIYFIPSSMALQCSCLEKPMDRGAWGAIVPGVPKSQRVTTEVTWHVYIVSSPWDELPVFRSELRQFGCPWPFELVGVPGRCQVRAWTPWPGCLPASAVTLSTRLPLMSIATLGWSAARVSSWQLIFSEQLVGMGLWGCAQSHKTLRLSLNGHHLSSWCVWIAAALLIGQQSLALRKSSVLNPHRPVLSFGPLISFGILTKSVN